MLFPVRKIRWVLVAIAAGILGVYTFNTLSHNFLPEALPGFFLARFDINAEANIPSWFSTALLLSVSLSAFLILRLQRQQPAAERAQRIFWHILMAVFLYLSLDEAAQLHELIDRLDHTKWIFFYAPPALAFFAYCTYHWRRQPKNESAPFAWIVGGFALFLLGAGFMEWVSYAFELSYALQHVEYVLEEGMEMLGAIGILTGCLAQANQLYAKVNE